MNMPEVQERRVWETSSFNIGHVSMEDWVVLCDQINFALIKLGTGARLSPKNILDRVENPDGDKVFIRIVFDSSETFSGSLPVPEKIPITSRTKLPENWRNMVSGGEVFDWESKFSGMDDEGLLLPMSEIRPGVIMDGKLIGYWRKSP